MGSDPAPSQSILLSSWQSAGLVLSTTVLSTQGNFFPLQLGQQCHQHSWRIHLNACDEGNADDGFLLVIQSCSKIPWHWDAHKHHQNCKGGGKNSRTCLCWNTPHNCWWPSGRDWWLCCCAGIVAFAHMQPVQGWLIHISPGQLSLGHHFRGWWHMYKTGAVGASEGYKVQQQQPKQMIFWIFLSAELPASSLDCINCLGWNITFYMLILGEISVEKISMLSSLGQSKE